MYLPSFPTITNEFNTNASFIQFSLTSCLLGLGLGQLVIGPMSDVQGRRKPLIVFLALYFVASLACAFAPTLTIFISARFIQGFAAAGGIVISRAVVRDVYVGRELTKFFALLMLINNLAPILAPVVGSSILLFTTWRGVFITLSLVGIILVSTITFRFEETLPTEKRMPSNLKQTIGNFSELIKDRKFIGYALTQSFITSGIFAYVSGTPFVYQTIYGVSPQVFSILFVANGIGIMIGTIFIGKFADLIPETRFLYICFLMSISSIFSIFILLLFHGLLLVAVISIFVFISLIGIIYTSSSSLAIQYQRDIA